jgi:hypothetical protein
MAYKLNYNIGKSIINSDNLADETFDDKMYATFSVRQEDIENSNPFPLKIIGSWFDESPTGEVDEFGNPINETIDI